ncbi:MAG: arginine--tRNA ligase [Gammaproteobacteria bacterium]
MDTLKNSLSSLVGKVLAECSGQDACDAHVITASKPEFGDYQANGAMALAKQLGRNPRELAQQAATLLTAQEHPLLESVSVAGPGFINLRLSITSLLGRAAALLAAPASLIRPVANPARIVVDYSSPNLAKEMHVGHLRGTIIGDSLARILARVGHTVVRQNHVGDWGTQFGMLIAHLRDAVTDGGDTALQLADLETFYREAKERFDSDAEFAEESRQSVVRLQRGDPDYLAAWQQFISESLRHCQAIYEKLGVTLSEDDLDAESFYNSELEIIVKELEQKELLSVSDGARCVFLPQFTGKEGEPLPVIIQKSDGGYLYSTTDLAAIKYRSFTLDIDRSLYVVDARQSLHFEQVFAVARAGGLASEKIALEHIAYGTMMGKDGRPFKTRSGDTVKLVELLDEAVSRAFDLVSAKNPDLSETERRNIANKVGIAAVKYADLSKNRTSDYVFDWSTMLSFDGNTAPYLLYAYARIKSILRKTDQAPADFALGIIAMAEERSLLLKILQLPEIVETVARDCYPNQLCTYLYELAGVFMRFYEACPILKAKGSERDTRLALLELTATALQQGLDLLGIETLERM